MTICIVLPVAAETDGETISLPCVFAQVFREPNSLFRDLLPTGNSHAFRWEEQRERALRRNRGGRSVPIRKGAIRVTRKPLPLPPSGRCAILMLPLFGIVALVALWLHQTFSTGVADEGGGGVQIELAHGGGTMGLNSFDTDTE
jgi:hypothetical protein